MDVVERKLLRFLFLKLLYDQNGGDEVDYVSDSGIIEVLESEYDRSEIEKAIRFLESERLITYTTGRKVKFEHEGVREIESAIEKPDQDTRHFPATVIFIGTMHSGSIQQGTSHSSQFGAMLDSLEPKCSYFVESSQLEERLDNIDERFSNGGWQLTLFPTAYRQGRYADANALRQVLNRSRSQLISDCIGQLGDAEFGVCSVNPVESMAMSFSGLFVYRRAYYENGIQYESLFPIEPRSLAPGQWLDFENTVLALGESFQFAERLHLEVGEELTYQITGTRLLNRYLGSMDRQYGLRNARGPTFAGRFNCTGTIADSWKDQCAFDLVSLCDKFEHGLADSEDMLDVLNRKFPE